MEIKLTVISMSVIKVDQRVLVEWSDGSCTDHAHYGHVDPGKWEYLNIPKDKLIERLQWHNSEHMHRVRSALHDEKTRLYGFNYAARGY